MQPIYQKILSLKEKPMAHLLFSLPGGAEWISYFIFHYPSCCSSLLCY